MTREQATAEIRSIVRTCRGPQILGDGKVQREYVKHWELIQSVTHWPSALSIIRGLEHFVGDHAELETDNWPAAYERFRSLVYRHVGCGYDFNDIVIAHPFDGKERRVTCPRCKMKILYTAPTYEITE